MEVDRRISDVCFGNSHELLNFHSIIQVMSHTAVLCYTAACFTQPFVLNFANVFYFNILIINILYNFYIIIFIPIHENRPCSDNTLRFPEVFTEIIVERFVFVRGMLNNM